MSEFTAITAEDLENYAGAYANDPMNRVMENVYSKTDIGELGFSTENAKKMQFRFSNEIKTMTAANQKSSGRCWLFAATNVLRERIAKEKNIENFELSQSYLAFWDKFERCNYFFDSVLDTASLPADDRTVSFIIGTGVFDGGQWDMFVNIVNKYGVVPKDAMPETYQSSNTGALGKYLNRYLRISASKLRSMFALGADRDALICEKKKMLTKVYAFLVRCYGQPPKEFDFEYSDRDGKYFLERGYTPLTYRDKYVGDFLSDYISVINSPTSDKPYGRFYTVKYLGNITGGGEVLYYNLPIDRLRELVVQQIKDGEVVWFGSDCGKYCDRDKRSWDDASYETTALTGLEQYMSKTDSLDYHDSQMDHAMVITGVNIDEKSGEPDRFKIENSWGSDGVNAGYYMSSKAWFDRYVYQAVINKKYLGEAVKNPSDIIELKPWDPMGSLAICE